MKRNLPFLLLLLCSLMTLVVDAQPATVSKTNPTKVYIHYMPWFTAPRNPGTGVTSYPTGITTSGDWGFHWCSDGSGANPNTLTTITDYTGASVSTRNIDGHIHPLIGPYDGSDPDVIEYHLLLMKLSGIDGVLIDWYGQAGNGAPDAGPLLINSNALISATGGVGLKYGLVMEDAAWTNMTAAQNNGAYAVTNYFNNSLYPGSTYITLGDMRGTGATNASAPLVCVFGPQKFKTPGQWNTILQGNVNAFLPLYNQSSPIGTDAGGEFTWPFPQAGQSGTPPAWYTTLSGYYAGNAVTIHNRTSRNVVLGTAYQGFFDFYLGNASTYTDPNANCSNCDADGIIPRNYNGNTLSATLALFNQNKSVLDGIQIATWNDFSEATIIEPTVEFGFASLDTIQKFTGVSYTEADLLQVYRLFNLRKQYAGNSTIQSELNQVFNYFVQLDIANAKSLMDCIVNSGGTNCTTLPIITSAGADTVAAGSALNYQITATTHNNDAIIRYGASGLPAGVSINTSTGVISGTSYAVGSYSATDSVTDANGTSFSTLIIDIANPTTDIPYNGTAATIPGIVQAENYDLGGQGVAYNDADASNNGGQYRPNEGVDIEATTDAGGGYDMGWINSGEWVQYIINVTQAGTYTMTARVASGTAGAKQFHVLLNNTASIGPVAVPATGGWQTWQTTTGITTPFLNVGQDTLRIAMDITGFNINYLTFTLNSSSTPLISSSLTDTATIGTAFNYTITASNTPTSYNATGLPAGLSINTATGVISGTPTTLGTSAVSISATNNAGTSYSTLAITINPAVPVISGSLTASGMAGAAFSYTITASSSPSGYSAGPLPAGLIFTASTGIISGTPTTVGSTNVTITATNAGGTSTARTLVITVTPASYTRYLSINASRTNNGSISIQWSVDSEVAIIRYEVIRSVDSINFNNLIASVTQVQNNYTTSATIYDTTDVSPAPENMYYFVKAYGANGSFFYSDTIKMSKLQNAGVYPNPVTNGLLYITFNNTAPDTYTAQLINAIGQPVYTTSIVISGSTAYPLQLPGRIPSGIYQLRLTDATGAKLVYKIAIKQ